VGGGGARPKRPVSAALGRAPSPTQVETPMEVDPPELPSPPLHQPGGMLEELLNVVGGAGAPASPPTSPAATGAGQEVQVPPAPIKRGRRQDKRVSICLRFLSSLSVFLSELLFGLPCYFPLRTGKTPHNRLTEALILFLVVRPADRVPAAVRSVFDYT